MCIRDRAQTAQQSHGDHRRGVAGLRRDRGQRGERAGAHPLEGLVDLVLDRQRPQTMGGAGDQQADAHHQRRLTGGQRADPSSGPADSVRHCGMAAPGDAGAVSRSFTGQLGRCPRYSGRHPYPLITSLGMSGRRASSGSPPYARSAPKQAGPSPAHSLVQQCNARRPKQSSAARISEPPELVPYDRRRAVAASALRKPPST